MRKVSLNKNLWVSFLWIGSCALFVENICQANVLKLNLHAFFSDVTNGAPSTPSPSPAPAPSSYPSSAQAPSQNRVHEAASHLSIQQYVKDFLLGSPLLALPEMQVNYHESSIQEKDKNERQLLSKIPFSQLKDMESHFKSGLCQQFGFSSYVPDTSITAQEERFETPEAAYAGLRREAVEALSTPAQDSEMEPPHVYYSNEDTWNHEAGRPLATYQNYLEVLAPFLNGLHPPIDGVNLLNLYQLRINGGPLVVYDQTGIGNGVPVLQKSGHRKHIRLKLASSPLKMMNFDEYNLMGGMGMMSNVGVGRGEVNGIVSQDEYLKRVLEGVKGITSSPPVFCEGEEHLVLARKQEIQKASTTPEKYYGDHNSCRLNDELNQAKTRIAELEGTVSQILRYLTDLGLSPPSLGGAKAEN